MGNAIIEIKNFDWNNMTLSKITFENFVAKIFDEV